jgi:hypothetical protein
MPRPMESTMRLHWREVVGFVMFASGTWIVLAFRLINPAVFCTAGFVSILGLTVLLVSLSERLPYRSRPRSLSRQDDLKDFFRGYPR